MGCSHSICITAQAGGGGQVGRPMSIGNNGGGSRNLGRNMLRSLKASEGSRFYDIYELYPGKLGEAAMGCVVRAAKKKRTGEMFAVKTFTVTNGPSKAAQRRILATLRNEIDLLTSLDHPNIIRAYESYEIGKDLHLVMELCRGGDLNKRTYTEAQAADVVRMVLSAIMHAHQKGIIHRDLKFENILWESDAPDAHIKLIDFGMSARFQEGMHLTDRVGSVYTMAPEVLEGNYTKKADLWSIGCITFHLIAGEPPFECEDEIETMKRLLGVKYFWPRGKKVSSEAKEFVYNLLKYDPRRRWTVEQAIASSWLRRSELGQRSGSEALAPPSTSPPLDPHALQPSKPSNPAMGTKVDEPFDELPPVEEQPSLENRMLSSMRSYRSYGALRRVALMVVAYHQSPDKLTLLRNEFVEFDTEKNGEISQKEMQKALESRGVAQEEIEELFKSLDVNGSGNICYLEFLAATIEAVGAADEVNENQEERLLHAFERLDTDGSGFITVANLKELMGPTFDEAMIRETIQEADFLKDGRVGWKEFLVLMRDRQDAGTGLAVGAVDGVDAVEEKRQALHSRGRELRVLYFFLFF
ncbi:unnamed protein product [Ascophyllum nodosum]